MDISDSNNTNIYRALIKDMKIFKRLANNEDVRKLPLVSRINAIKSEVIDLIEYYLPDSDNRDRLIRDINHELFLVHIYHNDKESLKCILKSSAEKFFWQMLIDLPFDRRISIYEYLSKLFVNGILDNIYVLIKD